MKKRRKRKLSKRKRKQLLLMFLLAVVLAVGIPLTMRLAIGPKERPSSSTQESSETAVREVVQEQRSEEPESMTESVEGLAGTIHTGVRIGGMDVSGMTAMEAAQALERKLLETKGYLISLNLGHVMVSVTAGDLGLEWSNSEVVQQAMALGQSGNMIQRYKTRKQLDQGPVNLRLSFDVEEEKARALLEGRCASACNRDPVEPTLKMTDSGLTAVEGALGYTLDVEQSLEKVRNYLGGTWAGGAGSLELAYATKEPTHKMEELQAVKDVMGQASTDYSSSSSARRTNIATAAEKINGVVLYPGDSFSTLEAITPFTEENGYEMANSYANGEVVESFGGGICQVSTTLYLAVLRAELEVTQRYNHSMLVNYVKPSMDAAIAENSGKDFIFSNNTDYPVYIHLAAWNGALRAVIYGSEYRASDRKVEYVSETLSTEEAGARLKSSDAPLGTINQTQSAHEGCSAELYKVVTEGGKEVSRERVNSSVYAKTDAEYEVGTSGNNVDIITQVKGAIARNDIQEVRRILRANGLG
ncbi:MAG TPA: hypothetical protein DF613_17125 [Lachnospiraceae bacterium]|nr:hypothetical protein [Lachnospiraceae bacterium]